MKWTRERREEEEEKKNLQYNAIMERLVYGRQFHQAISFMLIPISYAYHSNFIATYE